MNNPALIQSPNQLDQIQVDQNLEVIKEEKIQILKQIEEQKRIIQQRYDTPIYNEDQVLISLQNNSQNLNQQLEVTNQKVYQLTTVYNELSTQIKNFQNQNKILEAQIRGEQMQQNQSQSQEETRKQQQQSQEKQSSIVDMFGNTVNIEQIEKVQIKLQEQEENNQIYIFPRSNLQNLAQESNLKLKNQEGIQQLSQFYDAVRIIKEDGNNYYRAVGFAFLEHLIRQTTHQQQISLFLLNLQQAKGYFAIRKSLSLNGNSKHQQLRQDFIELIQSLKDRKQNPDFDKE